MTYWLLDICKDCGKQIIVGDRPPSPKHSGKCHVTPKGKHIYLKQGSF